MIRTRLLLLVAAALAALGATTVARVVAAPAVASGVPVDPRDAAVTGWLGHAAVVGSWREVNSPGSRRYQARVAGVGLVEVDAISHEVDEVVFESNLARAAGGSVSHAVALSAATTLAAQHYAGFAGLQMRDDALIDHKVVSEYRFQWQARRHGAWLPSTVTVGVNASTGRVMSYWSERVPVTVSTTAAITAAQARAAAVQLAHMAAATVADPSLEVVTTSSGLQRLVWVTQITEIFAGGAHIPNGQLFWTDARTGQTSLVART